MVAAPIGDSPLSASNGNVNLIGTREQLDQVGRLISAGEVGQARLALSTLGVAKHNFDPYTRLPLGALPEAVRSGIDLEHARAELAYTALCQIRSLNVDSGETAKQLAAAVGVELEAAALGADAITHDQRPLADAVEARMLQHRRHALELACEHLGPILETMKTVIVADKLSAVLIGGKRPTAMCDIDRTLVVALDDSSLTGAARTAAVSAIRSLVEQTAFKTKIEAENRIIATRVPGQDDPVQLQSFILGGTEAKDLWTRLGQG
ncbi:MAG: hypothetical protein K1X79_12175 [Oligoflexia bacterium]|nr:hypothetical protein [Oligoflexia bacterium]